MQIEKVKGAGHSSPTLELMRAQLVASPRKSAFRARREATARQLGGPRS